MKCPTFYAARSGIVLPGRKDLFAANHYPCCAPYRTIGTDLAKRHADGETKEISDRQISSWSADRSDKSRWSADHRRQVSRAETGVFGRSAHPAHEGSGSRGPLQSSRSWRPRQGRHRSFCRHRGLGAGSPESRGIAGSSHRAASADCPNDWAQFQSRWGLERSSR